ncbi:hypothetical protein CMI37_30100 [Candidatus Pacearchaeota archaeon]|nr:hypothetical protein [Candidatus Pacearchaeota archaeon]|tara:strand:- start:14439 stop:15143 length:705 start_codon:yes stop_codon:yes gene_type:complete
MIQDFTSDVEDFECSVQCVVRKQKEQAEREVSLIREDYQNSIDKWTMVQEQIKGGLTEESRKKIVKELEEETEIQTLNGLIKKYREEIKKSDQNIKELQNTLDKERKEFKALRNTWDLDDSIQVKVREERELNHNLRNLRLQKGRIEKVNKNLLKQHKKTICKEEELRKEYNGLRSKTLKIITKNKRLLIYSSELEDENIELLGFQDKLKRKKEKKEQVERFKKHIVDKFKGKK